MSDRGNAPEPARGPGARPARAPVFSSRPKESERRTRAPMLLWDRVRILSFLAGSFLLLTWGSMSINGTGFSETIRSQAQSRWWLLVLIGVEALRQVNYLLLEGSPRYFARWTAFWTRDRATDTLDPWTRFRLGRLLKVLAFLWIVGTVIASFYVHADGSKFTPVEGLFLAPLLLVRSLPQILQFVFVISLGVLQFVAIFWFMSKGGVETYMPDDIDTRFSDVKGQDAVLSRVKESLIFMEDPESIEARGGYVPGGILLWGPPGTGKTLMAQAVAGETAKPFVFVEPGAFNAMFFGVGILKVKGLYRKLRKLSLRYGGVIVFFDEADSLGNRGAISQPGGGWSIEPAWVAAAGCHGVAYVSEAARSSLVHGPSMYSAPGTREAVVMGGMGMGGGGMGTLQAMLAEMSGLTKPRGFMNRVIRRLLGLKPKPPPKYRILHIFATNMPQSLDEAMLRPGRIDRLYKVGYPQVEGRVATFRYYLARVRHELSDEQIHKLATITPYATGASIKDTVNEALVIAIRDERESISWADIIQAKQLKEHGLPDDHEYIERERHSVAIHEASHAVVAYRLRRHMTIDIATIERRGDVGGFVSSIPPEDQFVQWRSERDIDVMTFLASLAGERLFFDGDNSAGVGGDMRGATSIAAMMEGFWAMGQTIGSYTVNLGAIKGAQPVEDGTDRSMLDSAFGQRVEAKLRALYEQTQAILEEHRADVLAVAHALETHKTITGDDVAAIIEGHAGSLLDGRPYHDAAFRERLEDYHASVLAAHRAHAEVEGAIPVPLPPFPSELVSGSTAAIGPGEGPAVS